MDYVSESVFEEILASVLEERFSETESLTEHQRKALLDMESQLYFSCSLMSANTCFPVRLFIPPHAIILFVCPLKSLVNSHLRELRNRGISAASLSSEDVDENNLLKRTYSFVCEVQSPSYRATSGETCSVEMFIKTEPSRSLWILIRTISRDYPV